MYNDYELLYFAKEDIDSIVEILYKKYSNLLYSKAKKYSLNTNIDEYISEAKIALYEAVETYRDDYLFLTYLNICLDRRLLNYRKHLNRNKHKILNDALVINYEDTNTLISTQDERYNPEKLVIEESSYKELRNKILDKLTWKEELIFTLKEHNFTNKEISEITDNNLRTVYNIINRIKNKVSNLVSN